MALSPLASGIVVIINSISSSAQQISLPRRPYTISRTIPRERIIWTSVVRQFRKSAMPRKAARDWQAAAAALLPTIRQR
jgi:ABC-type branched-subunit amino acid transport system substrate-binding protein